MKALELAKGLDDLAYSEEAYCMNIFEDAAAELRRLAEVNAELLVALQKAINTIDNLNSAYGSDEIEDIAKELALVIAKAKEQQ